MSDKLTIQIVEDEALIAENLKYTLEDLGYRVIGVAYTYREAREALLTQRADLTLLDINLGSNAPDEDGLALARLMAPGSYPTLSVHDRLFGSGYHSGGYPPTAGGLPDQARQSRRTFCCDSDGN